MKLIGMFLLFFVSVFGAVSPAKTLSATAIVTDLAVDNSKIYAATASGTVDIFDRKTLKKQKNIVYPKIKNFMGEQMQPKLFSVDVLDGNVLAVLEDKDGFRSLYLNHKKIIADNAKLFIKKASFVDKNRVLLGLLSNEIMLIDLNTRKIYFNIQVNTSTFSDFAISENKKMAVIADESDKITMINIENGQIVGQFKGQNVDNIYQIDFKNGTILGCGQDRRLSVYNAKTAKGYYLEGDFLIYSGALSADGKKGAFAFNEKNEIKVFDVDSKKEIVILKGSKANLTRTIFLNSNEIIASCEDKTINIWRF